MAKSNPIVAPLGILSMYFARQEKFIHINKLYFHDSTRLCIICKHFYNFPKQKHHAVYYVVQRRVSESMSSSFLR